MSDALHDSKIGTKPNRDELAWCVTWLEAAVEPVLETSALGFPTYRAEVDRLVDAARCKFWVDRRYHSNRPDDVCVATTLTADLPTMKAVMTWFWRGERFCYGHLGAVIRSGLALAILRRALSLIEAMEEDPN